MNMGTRYTITEGVLRFAEDITDLNNISLKENKPFIGEMIEYKSPNGNRWFAFDFIFRIKDVPDIVSIGMICENN